MKEMNNTAKYVTHPGAAHQDEFLASCLLLAAGHEVYRGEAEAPSGAIPFDTGGGELDHHHLPEGGAGVSALHLVAAHLGIPLVGEWVEVVGVLDCGPQEQRSPLRPAAWAGNPLIRWFLDQFQVIAGPVSDNPSLAQVMTEIGTAIIAAGKAHSDDVAAIEARPLVEVAGVLAVDARGIKSHSATNAVGQKGEVEFMLVDGREPGTVNLLKKGGTPIPPTVPGETFRHSAGFMVSYKEGVA